MFSPNLQTTLHRACRPSFFTIIVFSIFAGALTGCANLGEGSLLGLLSSTGTSVGGSASGDGSGVVVPADWWNTNWTRRRKLTFDNSTRAENLDDFPVLIKLDATRIDYSATQAAGVDLCFVDSDGTQLSHEIETWNTAGTSYAWVKIPRIDASSSTDYIYVYYGGSGSCAQSTNAVWNTGYQGVWHLNQQGSDSLEFDTGDVLHPEIIHVSGTIYAMVYTNATGKGVIKTVTISSTGLIGSVLAAVTFEGGTADHAEILKTGTGIVSIAYIAAGGGTLKSYSIDTTTGAITTIAGTRVFDAAATGKFSFRNVSGTTYAVAHRGAGGDGFVTTMNIAADGTVGATIANLEFDITDAQHPNLIQISGTIFGVAYHGTGNDGILKTIQIQNDGTFGGVVDTLVFDTSTVAFDFDLVAVSGTIYAVVYQGAGSDGFIQTLDIAATGVITGSVATLEFDTASGIDPVITQVNGDIFAVAYEQSGGDGWIQTLRISSAGAITKITTWEYNVSRGNYPGLLTLSTGSIALVCACSNSDGFLYSMFVDSNGVLYDQLDSTSNNRHTQSAFNMQPNDQVADNIGGSLTFDGVNDGQFMLSPTLGANFSISMWVNPDASLGTVDGLIGAYNGTDGWRFRSGFGLGATGLTFSENATNFDAAAGTLTLNQWQQVGVTYDGDIYRLYKNGVRILASAGGQAAPLNKTYIVIGRLVGTGYEFPGGIDEVRISGTTRSANWISAQYASQADTFITFGSEISL